MTTWNPIRVRKVINDMVLGAASTENKWHRLNRKKRKKRTAYPNIECNLWFAIKTRVKCFLTNGKKETNGRENHLVLLFHIGKCECAVWFIFFTVFQTRFRSFGTNFMMRSATLPPLIHDYYDEYFVGMVCSLVQFQLVMQEIRGISFWRNKFGQYWILIFLYFQ